MAESTRWVQIQNVKHECARRKKRNSLFTLEVPLGSNALVVDCHGKKICLFPSLSMIVGSLVDTIRQLRWWWWWYESWNDVAAFDYDASSLSVSWTSWSSATVIPVLWQPILDADRSTCFWMPVPIDGFVPAPLPPFIRLHEIEIENENLPSKTTKTDTSYTELETFCQTSVRE